MVQGTPSDTATMILAELARQADMVDYFSGGGGWNLTTSEIQRAGKGSFPALLPHCFLGAFVLRKENQAFPCSERERERARDQKGCLWLERTFRPLLFDHKAMCSLACS